jgi:HEAT repeat protein
MLRRTYLIIAFAVFTAGCSGGAGGALNELLDQVRLDDPLSDRTYAENREVIEVPESVPMLTDHLANDPSAKVRQYCALILGRIGDAEAVPALTNALNDDDAGVRDRAVAALSQIGADEAEGAFIATLSTGSREAKITVLVELERAASVNAVPAIVDVAKANEGMVSKNAIDALGGIGDASAVTPLVGMALDANMAENLRRAAILNLGRIDVPEAAAGLQEVIGGLNEQTGVDELLQYARDQAR